MATAAPQEIEAEIRNVLATENNYHVLTEKLFGPSGLFGLLGPTREERLRIIATPLYKEAQKKRRALQFAMVRAFREQLDKMPSKAGQANSA